MGARHTWIQPVRAYVEKHRERAETALRGAEDPEDLFRAYERLRGVEIVDAEVRRVMQRGVARSEQASLLSQELSKRSCAAVPRPTRSVIEGAKALIPDLRPASSAQPSCPGKKIYRRRLDAKIALARIDRRAKKGKSKRHEIRIYWCRECEGHHLTSRA